MLAEWPEPDTSEHATDRKLYLLGCSWDFWDLAGAATSILTG